MATSNLSRRMIYKRGYDCIQTCFEFHFQSSDAKEGKSKKGRYEDLDMDLAKILERDVLNSNPGVDWDHISRLSHAKRLLFEAINCASCLIACIVSGNNLYSATCPLLLAETCRSKVAERCLFIHRTNKFYKFLEMGRIWHYKYSF